MKVRPLIGKAFVEPVKLDNKIGSLFIAGEVTGSNLFYKVLAVGDDIGEVEVGDTVILSQYAGSPVDFEGKQCKMVGRDEMLAVVEE